MIIWKSDYLPSILSVVNTTLAHPAKDVILGIYYSYTPCPVPDWMNLQLNYPWVQLKEISTVFALGLPRNRLVLLKSFDN